MARQWQTVLVSVVAHVVGMFLLVVVPLLALDGLPALKSTVEYVPVEMKVPPFPAAPKPQIQAAATTTAPGPPLDAPTSIRPESPGQAPAIDLNAIARSVGVPGGVNLLPASAGDFEVPSPSRSSTEPVRPGGKVKPPDRVAYVRPDYPPIAVSARVSGSVIIEAIIGTDGQVRDAKILRSIPLLDEAALKAVRQWRYTPTLLNGVPVAVVMTVTVTFTLERLVF